MFLNVFVGFDPREEIGSHAFTSSVLANTTSPVALVHLSKQHLERHLGEHFASGTNDFTVTRFLVPYLMGFSGVALFVDGADMIAHGDLAEIFKYHDPMKAVHVVKHDYKTKHNRKYRGSKMESDNVDYDRKQWASVMLINCGHPDWRKFTPDFVANTPKIDLLQFKHIRMIDELPIEWNWLVDEFGENENAKILHWTAGVPAFQGHKDAPMASDWFAYQTKVNSAAV
jgi:hypothetical protein